MLTYTAPTTTPAAPGTLTDASYAVTGSGPNWGRATTPTSTITLLGNVSAQSGVAVFQYFKYESYLGTDGNLYWTIPDGSNPQPVTGAVLAPDPLPTPLSAGNADATVEVMTNLLVGPTSESLNNSNLPAASDPVQDSVSLRLTTPPNYSSVISDYAPCE